MRFLILNTINYPEYLSWFYTQRPGLKSKPYEAQMRAWNEGVYFRANFYSENLRKLGHEARDIYVNNEFLQRAWAREHGLGLEDPPSMTVPDSSVLQWARRRAAATPLRYLKPLFSPLLPLKESPRPAWYYDILAAQIQRYKPDVLLNTSMYRVSSAFLKTIKPHVRLLVGQHAAGLFCSQLPRSEDPRRYDLVVSSFLPTVQWFRERGIPAELLRLGFEPRILSLLNGGDSTRISTSFVGSVPLMHSSRVRFLEDLCSQLDIEAWAPSVEHLHPESPLREAYMGMAWGLQMYQILARSLITLNHHGDVPSYANNMRLFEATGVGTLLITDWKGNLNELFEPGKEVVAYRSAEECAELIQYYLKNEAERKAIARAGQQRTLKEHTYCQRMADLSDLVNRYL